VSALEDAIQHEVVVVSGRGGETTLYAHSALLSAFHDALLDRLAVRVPQGSSARTACRALGKMRTQAEHQIVLRSAIATLERCGNPVPQEEVTPETVIVACFPGTTLTG